MQSWLILMLLSDDDSESNVMIRWIYFSFKLDLAVTWVPGFIFTIWIKTIAINLYKKLYVICTYVCVFVYMCELT